MPSDLCAECDAEVGVEHRLPGPRELGWYSEHPPPGTVLSRCPACLAISANHSAEHAEGGRPAHYQPALWLSGAEVARAIETLRGFESRGELREGFLQLQHSRKPSAMLRVPEVFAVARGAFGASALHMMTGAFRVTGRNGVWFPRTPEPFLHNSYDKWPDEDRTFKPRPNDPSILLPTYYPRAHAQGPSRDDAVPQGASKKDGDDPFARLTRTALRVLRGTGVWLEVVPPESEWVASGVLRCFRLCLDHAIPPQDE